MPKVLIHVDEMQRDRHVANWISMWLSKWGIKSYFCGRYTRKALLEAIQPDLFLDSHFNQFSLEELRKFSARTQLCVLPTEGAIFNPSLRTFLYFGNYKDEPERSKLLTKTFVWGERTKASLLESGFFQPSQISVVGSPQYDAYLVPRDPSHKNDAVGFMSMFKGINIFDSRNYLEYLFALKNGQGYHYAEDRNVEDLVWYHTCGFRVFTDILQTLNESQIFPNIKWRAHQHENASNYKFLSKNFQNLKFEFSDNGPFFNWLDGIKIAIMCKSTTIVEMMNRQIPVISIERLMGPRLDEHMNMPDNRIPFLKYVYRPESHDELLEMMKRSKSNALSSIPKHCDVEEYHSLVKDFFGFPRQVPSTYLIAQEIKSLLESRAKVKAPAQSLSGYRFRGFLSLTKSMLRDRLGRQLPQHTVRQRYFREDNTAVFKTLEGKMQALY